MDLKQVKNLLTLIAESGVNEVYIEEGDFKIKVKIKSDTVQHILPASVNASPPTMEYANALNQNPVHHLSSPAPSKTPTALDSRKSGELIKSPIVGTFYSASSPDAKPFTNVGDVVSKGDTLCIIEAMKIMNEIESEVTGTITKILVKNGQPVEYDQPLFEIDPA
jgi:acetyl-CoA carboxylase biotin carboxyl carrier protein